MMTGRNEEEWGEERRGLPGMGSVVGDLVVELVEWTLTGINCWMRRKHKLTKERGSSWWLRWWFLSLDHGGARWRSWYVDGCLWQMLVAVVEREREYMLVFYWLWTQYSPPSSHETTPIYRRWKRDVLSLQVPNLGPWFDPEGSQPLVQSGYHKLLDLLQIKAGWVSLIAIVVSIN